MALILLRPRADIVRPKLEAPARERIVGVDGRPLTRGRARMGLKKRLRSHHAPTIITPSKGTVRGYKTGPIGVGTNVWGGSGGGGGGGGGSDLSINSTVSGAAWFSTYNSVNGTGTGNNAVLDDNSGTTKWSGINGGGAAGLVAIGTSAGNYYKLVSTDATSFSRMTNATSKWGAPSVGQYIIYSMLFQVSFVATLGQAHYWQVARAVTVNYFFFTHFLYTTDRAGPAGTPAGYMWFIFSPYQLSYPQNNYACPIANATTYVINLRLFRESSTTARIQPRIYNLDGTVYADGTAFSNGNDDPLGTHNLTSDNPALLITGGNDDNFYGSMEFGNNGDASNTNTSNFLVADNHSVFITSDSTFWPGARIPV